MVNEVTMTWVANYLKLEPYMIDRIHVEGLTALKVPDLKNLWQTIRPWCSSLQGIGTCLRSGSRKQAWVDTLERAFQNELIVQLLNEGLLPSDDLKGHSHVPLPSTVPQRTHVVLPPPQPPPAAPPPSARAAPVKSQLHPRTSLPPKVPQRPRNVPPPPPLPARVAPPKSRVHPRMDTWLPFAIRSQLPSPGSPTTAATKNSRNHHSAARGSSMSRTLPGQYYHFVPPTMPRSNHPFPQQGVAWRCPASAHRGPNTAAAAAAAAVITKPPNYKYPDSVPRSLCHYSKAPTTTTISGNSSRSTTTTATATSTTCHATRDAAAKTTTTKTTTITPTVKVKHEPGGTRTVTPRDGVMHNMTGNAPAHATTTSSCDTPLTFHEYAVMTALRQMGFQNEIEIRQAIRCNVGGGPEECMMWIIQQREEQDEAKKIDEARVRSEELRQQATLARRRHAREQFDAARTVDELTQTLFPTSIVLKYASKDVLHNCKKAHPCLLYKFLQLEQNIIKWYNEVPWCYLVDLAERWKRTKPSAFDLESVISELEVSIYSLENQKGGIPAIFFDKQREAERNGKSIRPPSNEDSRGQDDIDNCEVIEIFEPQSKKIKHSSVPHEKSIIEIL